MMKNTASNEDMSAANDHLTAELNGNTKIDSLTEELAMVKDENERALTYANAQIQRLRKDKDDMKCRFDDMEQSLCMEKITSGQTIRELRAIIAAKDELIRKANSESDNAKKQAESGTLQNICQNEALSPAEDSSPGSAASLPMGMNEADGGQMVVPSIGDNSDEAAAKIRRKKKGLEKKLLRCQ